MNPEELISPDFDESERSLVLSALNEWSGPAACTEELAVAMGFDGLEGLFVELARLRGAIGTHQPLSRLDWCRALLATEIVFVSDVVGSGHDWIFTTGIPDDQALVTLRRIQRKVVLRPLVGAGFGTRPPRPARP